MKKYYFFILLLSCSLSSCKHESLETASVPAPEFIEFSFDPQYNSDKGSSEDEMGIIDIVQGVIDQEEGIIDVFFEDGGVNLESLTPSFKTTFGSYVKSNGVVQESNLSASDFTSPVEYQVISRTGQEKNYVVVVANGQNNSADFLYYSFNVDVLNDQGNPITENVIATVDQKTAKISAQVNYEADLSSLKPVFRISPRAKAYIGTTLQVSGESSVDLSAPLTYMVTSESGNTKEYTVLVEKKEPWSLNELISFSLLKSDNPSLDADVNAIIDHEKKELTLTLSDRFDITTSHIHAVISPKATLEIDGELVSEDLPFNLAGKNTVSVIAQNGEKNEYSLNVVIKKIGAFNFSDEYSGMTVSSDGDSYTFSGMENNAEIKTLPIDYVNPGKVLSFEYKSSNNVKMAMILNDNLDAKSDLWDLSANSEWTTYHFDMEIFTRVFNWNKSVGKDWFTLIFKDAAGAEIQIRNLEIRVRTAEEQKPFDENYWLNYTGVIENNDFTSEKANKPLAFRNLTTCYAPGYLEYEIEYAAEPMFNLFQSQTHVYAELARIQRDLDADMKYIEFEAYVENQGMTTLNALLKYNPSNQNEFDDYRMGWNWETGCLLRNQFDMWVRFVYNMNRTVLCEPSDGTSVPRAALDKMYSLKGDDLYKNPKFYLYLGLANGVPTTSTLKFRIRGLKVTKSPGVPQAGGQYPQVD